MILSIIRLLIFLLVFLCALTACNLSETPAAKSLQVIISATPSAESTDNDVTLTESLIADVTAVPLNNNTQHTISQFAPEQSQSNDNYYYVWGARPQNQCAIQATVTTNIRTASNTNATIVGQLIGGEWVAISRLVNGWYQIDLSPSPVHRMWISSDPTELDIICHCDANGCARNQTTPTPDVNSDLYYVGNPMPILPNGCYVYTTGDFNVNIRAAQSETSAILGQLRANQWIPIRYFVNGWFGLDMPNTPVDGAYIANGATTLSSSCSCGVTTCSPIADTGTCEMISSATEVTSIYTEPANWSAVVGQLKPSTVYTAIAQSSSGWYELMNGGWVSPSFLRSQSDTGCRHLPTIIYDAPLLKCELVNTTDEIATIRREPDGEYFGRFAPNLRLGVIKRDGIWYQVYVAAFENAGWVDGSAMSLAGDCNNFK